MGEKMLIVSAHAGDFLWRAGGTIAKHISEGTEVHLLILTYGIRGEANDLWKSDNMTFENAKQIRHSEVKMAAKTLGVDNIYFWDYEDYPFEINLIKQERLATLIRKIRPDFILTHDKNHDAYNPDHGVISDYVWRATIVASAAGAEAEGFEVGNRYVPIFGFEPHYSEVSNFKPGIYIDITDFINLKIDAMDCFNSQTYMKEQYMHRAVHRARDVVGRTGNKNCKYAEAFSIWYPIYKLNKFAY